MRPHLSEQRSKDLDICFSAEEALLTSITSTSVLHPPQKIHVPISGVGHVHMSGQ